MWGDALQNSKQGYQKYWDTPSIFDIGACTELTCSELVEPVEVRPRGIEPRLRDPQSRVLSVERWAHAKHKLFGLYEHVQKTQ